MIEHQLQIADWKGDEEVDIPSAYTPTSIVFHVLWYVTLTGVCR
jgi:hypothetical protein